jgi:hypothetical protein
MNSDDFPGMYYGQVRFTSGKAAIDWQNPSFDPNPCFPFHTDKGELAVAGYGQYEGWPSNFGMNPPQTKTPFGYEFGYDTGADNEVSVVYVTPKTPVCLDKMPVDQYELMDAIKTELKRPGYCVRYVNNVWAFTLTIEHYDCDD